jgi:dCTP deaminase
MGPQYYVTPGKIDFDPRSGVVRELKDQEHFRIPSGQFAFLLTEETIEVPANALAFISIRFAYKRRGLVNVSGFHVDPGFQGRLIFSVYNAGPSEIQIQRGDQLFLIWFCDLDAQSDEKYRKCYNEKVQRQESIPSDFASAVAGHIYSPTTLIEDTRQNKSLLDQINWVGRIFAGIVITILLGAVGVGYKIFEHHEARISRMEDRLMTSNPNAPVTTRSSESLVSPQPSVRSGKSAKEPRDK